MTAVPYVAAAGSAITAQDYNDNFDALEAAIDNLDGSKLITYAGLVATQITDRYIAFPVVVPIVPYSVDGADWDPGVAINGANTLPAALTTMLAWFMDWEIGCELWVASMTIQVIDAVVDAGIWPTFSLSVDGAALGGGPITLDPTAGQPETFKFRVGNPNPITDPLAAISANSTFAYQIGKTGAGNPTLRGLTAALLMKAELHR